MVATSVCDGVCPPSLPPGVLGETAWVGWAGLPLLTVLLPRGRLGDGNEGNRRG